MNNKGRKFAFLLMFCLVVAWGFDYVAVKFLLEEIATLPLICLKYCIGSVLLLVIKSIKSRKFFFSIRDLPLLVVCVLLGNLLYYAFEYGAMAYLPVSLISIMLAFVPVLSVVVEYIIWKRAANAKIWIGIAVSIIGVVFVIGGDLRMLFSGSAVGYLLVFGAVFSWNAYNFCVSGLSRKYRPLDLTLYQTICTALLALPFLLRDPPELSIFSGSSLWMLLYIGLVCEGAGFLIYVNAIDKLGPTPCALFSNMLPVSAAFFGWLFLNERIVTLQIAGGVIVVAAGILVILEKSKLDEKRQYDAGVSG